MRYLYFCLFALMLFSCKTHSYTQSENIVVHHDTVVVNTIITDTISKELQTIVHDSIYVVCDSVGKVVYKEVYRYVEKDNTKEEKQTLSNEKNVVVTDVVLQKEETKVEKEKGSLSKTLANILILLGLLFAISTALKHAMKKY